MGWTALHYASSQGDRNVVKILVNHNADINIAHKVIDIMRMKSNL